MPQVTRLSWRVADNRLSRRKGVVLHAHRRRRLQDVSRRDTVHTSVSVLAPRRHLGRNRPTSRLLVALLQCCPVGCPTASTTFVLPASADHRCLPKAICCVTVHGTFFLATGHLCGRVSAVNTAVLRFGSFGLCVNSCGFRASAGFAPLLRPPLRAPGSGGGQACARSRGARSWNSALRGRGSQVRSFLTYSFGVNGEDFSVHRGCLEDVLIVFRSSASRDLVLHSAMPSGAPFQLKFRPWGRQSLANVRSLLFRVLLKPRGIPTHAWHLSTVERILSSSCTSLILTPDTMARDDLSCFRVVAWCADPGLIPKEVDLIVPEPVEQFVDIGLFLRPDEIIHSKQLCLSYKVAIHLIEV
ncbi:uncharacterized protein LOC133886474 [Phragmites australis]|uniref:uncharacterized protein LOC133886474 n=1 Tax=Phragmites australis TaxID=29695 RepID=UPI002D76C73F|nr:uncharacterized protein LOC133886474 [Phragmites australis]